MKAASKSGPFAAPRWYTHRWNRELSWRLILGFVPWVPRIVRPPLHFVTTLLCFLAMGRERRAARRNLGIVTGRKGPSSLWLAFRLFYNFSKFMVAYADLPPHGNGDLDGRLLGREQGEALLRRALAGKRGVIYLGMHLGQWDLALIALARLGIPITVVMRREDEEAARFAAAARHAAGLRVAHAGDDPWLMVEVLGALRRNEIVALQGDRPYGQRTAVVSLFGRRVRIPAGPADLARASGAPIIPAVLVFEGHRRLRFVFGEPVHAAAGGPPGAGGGPDPQRVAGALESIIAAYPDQWFNFYDVWEPAAGDAPAAPRPDGHG